MDEATQNRSNAQSYMVGEAYVDEKAEHVIKPTKWELFLAGEKGSCCFHCSACWFFFGIGMTWLAVFLAKAVTVGTDILDLEQADLKSHPVVEKYYGFLAAKNQIDDGCHLMHEEPEACNADNRCYYDKEAMRGRGQTGECKEITVCPAPTPKNRSKPLESFFVVYEALNKEENLLDDELFSLIHEFESTLLTTANGALKKDGSTSAWTDWCQRDYSDGSKEGTCAPPMSMLNIFTMNSHGRSAVKAASGGSPTLGCLCGDEDKLCDICDSAGSVVPASMARFTSCARAGSAASPAAAPPPSSGTNASLCSSRSSGGMDFTSTCKGMPRCQWSGPGFSMCSSRSYYYPSDSNGVVTADEKDRLVAHMCDDAQTLPSAMRRNLFGVNMDCVAKRAPYARTMFFAGANEGGTRAEKDAFNAEYIEHANGWYRKETLLETEIERKSAGNLRIMLLSTSTAFSSVLALVIQDGVLSVGSLVMVWLYMWYAMESLFLATCGVFEILMSLPVGLSLWTVIFNQRITFLQLLTVYMILGIGADDVFIVFDAWQQSALADEEVTRHWMTRFSWAYRRSFMAMLVTTSTTCGSFIIGATSPLPSVQTFCIFAAIVVLVDWMFCVSFFASAIIVYERHFKGVACFCRHCGMENRDAGKVCGPGCMWGVPRALMSRGGKDWRFVDKPVLPGEIPPQRALERFTVGPLYKLLSGVGGKVMIVLWSCVVLACSISAAVSLRTAQEAAPIGRPHIDFTRVIDVMVNQFPSYRQPTAYAVFGMDKEQPVEFGLTRSDDIPRFASAGAPELASEEGQERLLALCQAADLGKNADGIRCGDKACLVEGSSRSEACVRDEETWRRTGIHVVADPLCEMGRYCFMEEFARFWASEWGGCRAKATQLTCSAAPECLWDGTLNVCHSPKSETDYVRMPTPDFLAQLGGDGFRAYLERRQKVLASLNREFDHTLYNQMTGFKLSASKDRIDFAYIGWNATYPAANTVDEANAWYERWDGFFKKHAAGLGGYQTTSLYLFMATQNEMVKSAILGVCMSLLIAGVVMLIATRNWRTSLLGFVNVVAVTAIFLGLMPLFGWSLGEYECIFVIACVGLSVDYTLHMMHSYNHATSVSRLERSRSALGEMGVSVFSSAITTLLATSLLFGCGLQFFFQFGGFIFVVILLSIFLTVLFLMPIMMLVGPEHDQGKFSFSVPRLWRIDPVEPMQTPESSE
eukprot:TRINITY_DN7505_c0_g1_i1.p1 TRINITY_DN7505_c0_g1~~TRINITY_DN7505_c0_g1_i1.p1  ORF type:complete len:1210 (+),score=152.69 TRINITY_DN7505_c0_g1_i1:49-3678(+)